jgi:hypothetical protein
MNYFNNLSKLAGTTLASTLNNVTGSGMVSTRDPKEAASK